MPCWPSGTRSSNDAPLTPPARVWIGFAVVLAASALGFALAAIPPAALDWQPALAAREPWRAFSAIAVHYSTLHLGANLVGTALVAALGAAARVSAPMVWAWIGAWPLTQLGLLARPDLTHYGGLSGVLHAGAAVVAVHLLASGPRPQRLIGAGLATGLLVKVLGESPWGAALRNPAGWDIATAPLAHATGLSAGVACALMAMALRRPRRTPT